MPKLDSYQIKKLQLISNLLKRLREGKVTWSKQSQIDTITLMRELLRELSDDIGTI